MKIASIKQLESLMKVCRRQGVRSMKIEGFEFTLENDVPTKVSKRTQSIQTQADNGLIDTPDMLTPDQLIDWSTGAGGAGVPSNVPQPNGSNS